MDFSHPDWKRLLIGGAKMMALHLIGSLVCLMMGMFFNGGLISWIVGIGLWLAYHYLVFKDMQTVAFKDYRTLQLERRSNPQLSRRGMKWTGAATMAVGEIPFLVVVTVSLLAPQFDGLKTAVFALYQPYQVLFFAFEALFGGAWCFLYSAGFIAAGTVGYFTGEARAAAYDAQMERTKARAQRVKGGEVKIKKGKKRR